MQCPHCNRTNPDEAKFCGECGRRLTEPADQARSPSPRSPAIETDYHSRLAAYTPKHLTERVLTIRSALEGERRVVTVLFTDTAREYSRGKR